MRRILFLAVPLFVNACIEKGGRARPSPVDTRSGDLQGRWESHCEAWGNSENSGSSRSELLVNGANFIMGYEFSRQNDCGNRAVTLQSNMSVVDMGSSDYPRTIDLRYGKMYGTIYDEELLAEANAEGDCGAWQLGVAKDLAECDVGDEPSAEPGSDMLYQIYGISGQELRFGLMEWESESDSYYDGSSPEARPRTLSDYEIFYRAGAYTQSMFP